MRAIVRNALDAGTEYPAIAYLLAAALAAVSVWYLPIPILNSFVENSLPAIPGVVFALFGFAITAISVLTSLKGSPFFELLQQQNFNRWKSLIGAFIHEAGLYAFFGLLTIIVNEKQITTLTDWPYKIVLFIYCFFFLSSIFITINAVYLLRLVANTPIVRTNPPAPIDMSSLQSFRDPTAQQPPRRIP